MKNLFGRSLEELETIVEKTGEKKFRAKQLYDWIYKKKVDSLDACHNLPKSLLEKLKEADYGLYFPKVVEVLTDPVDGTQKYLLELEDGNLVESVLMKYNYGNTVCLSTQVGCNMGCTFCASGKNGKVRNLTKEEIAGQLVVMERESGDPVSNIVLMGMGEPLDNYDNVIDFITFVNKDLNIGQRHVTLSTCGLVDKIYKLAEEDLQINLAISLHSPFQEKRQEVLPVAKRYPLGKLIQAASDYFYKTGRRVTYEYTVIPGFNDRRADALELKKLVGGQPHHINLIPLNTIDQEPSVQKESVKLFNDLLNDCGITSTIRKKTGSNIEAACGQLRNRRIEVT